LGYTQELIAAQAKKRAAQKAGPQRNEKPWWEVLEVPRTASLDEVRKRFREIAKKHHPDIHSGKGDPEAMRAAIEAMNEARKEKSA
jgi:curved DNA-binding protein CbpA